MRINITCKLNDADACYFLVPIFQIRNIYKLVLYRNNSPISENAEWGYNIDGVYHIG